MRDNWGRGFRKNRARVRAAVRETAGQRLTFAGEPIRAVFHSASAGRTESSEALWGPLPYLVSVESPETAADVPGFETEVRLTPEELRAAVSAAYPDIALPEDPAAWLGEEGTDASGRVSSLAIGDQTVSGAEGTGAVLPALDSVYGIVCRRRIRLHRSRQRPRRGHEPVRRERDGKKRRVLCGDPRALLPGNNAGMRQKNAAKKRVFLLTQRTFNDRMSWPH